MANQNNTTAVDWLIEQLKELDRNGFNLQVSKLNELGMQAREMFRKQIEQAYIEGCLDTYGCDKPDTNKTDEYFAEQYYNQTYGKSE
jgi:hypothetical protein